MFSIKNKDAVNAQTQILPIDNEASSRSQNNRVSARIEDPPHHGRPPKTYTIFPSGSCQISFWRKDFLFLETKGDKAQVRSTFTGESFSTAACSTEPRQSIFLSRRFRAIYDGFFSSPSFFRHLTCLSVINLSIGRERAFPRLRSCGQVVICRHINDPTTRSVR